jgi:uncharacterized protein YkwD
MSRHPELSLALAILLSAPLAVGCDEEVTAPDAGTPVSSPDAGPVTALDGGSATGDEDGGVGPSDGGPPDGGPIDAGTDAGPPDPCEGIDACVTGDGCCPSTCAGTEDLDCVDCRGAWPEAWAAAEDATLAAINEQRAADRVCRGEDAPSVTAVVMDPQLRESARCHALDMALNDYTSHTGLDDSSFVDRARTAGYADRLVNENLAWGQRTAEGAVGAWMGSETGHCEAVMNAGAEEMGIGHVTDPDGSYENVRETGNWPYIWVMVSGRDR